MTAWCAFDSSGHPLAGLDGNDRGLAYGDGVFETLRIDAGEAVWWREHWQRLIRGAATLALPMPDESAIAARSRELIAGRAQGVLKLVLTRGVGGRGYAPPAQAKATVLLSWHELPDAEPVNGLNVRWCSLRLSAQPALAGIKSLNRLENVLARAEWSDPAIHEGLLRDADDRLVCATASNVFVRHDGIWQTPRLDRCGVAGIARDWLLRNAPGAVEADLPAGRIESAEAVLLCNSVRGLRQVRRLGDRRWSADAGIADLRARLAAAEPAFRPPA